ncbi:hypothetical protein GH714_005594 [Hevea brasiliensis]|uniref:Serpin domain-containing protein n=1 Tax=Hevea brasiliensis TaxID=3981 RepID=A0A6A6MBP0_HEVBR|nr:hypothetical protein GH714_005594 [Hevea brasiliensis]
MDTSFIGFHIPGPSIPAIPLLFMFVLIPIYDRIFVPLARKITGIPNGIRYLQRIGVGLVLSAISMAVSGIVETHRKSVAIEHKMVDSVEPLPMSVFWLGFQYAIFGAADMFTMVGLLDFFYAESSAGMKSLSTAIPWCSLAFGYFMSSVVVEIVNKASVVDGTTLEQLLAFLKSKATEEICSFSEIVSNILADGSANVGPCLSFASGAWIDKSLTFKTFSKRCGQVQEASNHVDFRIKLMLIPGSYLQIQSVSKEIGNKSFESDTEDRDFYLCDGSTVRVPFMTSKKKNQLIRRFKDKGFKALGLPYAQGEDKRKFSMYLFLPDAKDGLPALLEQITSESGFLDSHLLMDMHT